VENNWKYKSLQNLEKRSPPAIGSPSYLVKRCSELFHQPLIEYTVEDIRIMIGQQIALDYLVPLAIEQLNINILSEGDYYPGDLLVSVLRIDKVFWIKHNALLTALNGLIKDNKDILLESDIPKNLLEGF
jgi:hypothetical protein